MNDDIAASTQRIMIFRKMITNFEKWKSEAIDEQSKQVWQQRINQHQYWIDQLMEEGSCNPDVITGN